MPRIRKKTSNRTKINDRAKIRRKVKETKRKKAKEAKKNPQWKSRKPKDPGIPNDFPYKDQILGEVAEQRRLAAEEKLKRQEERNAARQASKAAERAAGSDSEAGSEEDEEMAEEEEEPVNKKQKLDVGAESIASLSAKLVKAEIKSRPKNKDVGMEAEDSDEDVPILANQDLPTLGSVLDKADVVIELLDARDPTAFRSKALEEAVKEKGKKMLFVLNKIDTCPRESVEAWSKELRSQHPTLLFRSASAFLPESALPQPDPTVPAIPSVVRGKGKAKAKLPSSDALGTQSIIKTLSQWANEQKSTESKPLAVAVVGLTNVGKSSFINSLVKKPALPVYTLAGSSRGPTTTELVQEVPLGDGDEESKILFIDTPGLSFQQLWQDAPAGEEAEEDEEDEEADDDEEDTVAARAARTALRAQDILLRNKGRIDRLKDPRPPVDFLVSRANTEDLMLLYSLPAFAKGDPVAFLSGVARANQLVKKRGELDLNGAARIVLRDWSVGKLSRFTLPATTPSTSTLTSPPISYSQEEDAAILATLSTRKELRKRKQGSIVLVRFAPTSTIEERQVDLDEPWPALAGDESEDEDEEDDAEGMDVDADEEEDEEEVQDGDSDEGEEEEDSVDEEEDVTPPPPSKAQKRKRDDEPVVPQPKKKVAIAPLPSKKGKGPVAAPAEEQPQSKQPLKGVLKHKTSVVAMPSGSNKNKNEADSSEKSKSKPKTKTKSTTVGKVATATTTESISAPPARKTANVPVRSSKSSTTTAPTTTANGKKAKTSAKTPASEPEAYDFGKYF